VNAWLVLDAILALLRDQEDRNQRQPSRSREIESRPRRPFRTLHIIEHLKHKHHMFLNHTFSISAASTFISFLMAVTNSEAISLASRNDRRRIHDTLYWGGDHSEIAEEFPFSVTRHRIV
jgi:hypothetical protein